MPLRFLTAGESHGPSLTAILDGMPAGLAITPDIINKELARRQQGFGLAHAPHLRHLHVMRPTLGEHLAEQAGVSRVVFDQKQRISVHKF